MAYECRFQLTGYNSYSVRDGVVHYIHIDENGRQEWDEPLIGSRVHAAIPEWAWDAAYDPRNDDAA